MPDLTLGLERLQGGAAVEAQVVRARLEVLREPPRAERERDVGWEA